MPQIKLVVWDLDNTLWNGTVYYTDRNNIRLKSGKMVLKKLKLSLGQYIGKLTIALSNMGLSFRLSKKL